MILTMQLQLLFSHSAGFLIIGIILFIAFSFFIYRFTNPPVSTFLRILLSILRSAVLVLLLFVLFQTVLHISFMRKIVPTLAVVVDESSSMSLTDNSGSRAEQMQAALSSLELNKLADEFRLHYYRFSSQVNAVERNDLDSLKLWGDETDIRTTLMQIIEENRDNNLQGIVLLTDGNYNTGGNPVRLAEFQPVPVHSIVIGSTDKVIDAELARLQSNPTAYVNQPTILEATVRTSGISETTLPVELYVDGQKTQSRNIRITSSPSEQTVQFSYTPEKAGQKQISVRIPKLENELTSENNASVDYMDVLKSKIKILLIAGHPAFDISFLKRHLDSEKYEISTLIQKSAFEFYEQPLLPADLRSTDIFVLLDYPTQYSSPDFLSSLADVVNSAAKPVLLVPGSHFSLQKFAPFGDSTPLSTAQKQTQRILPMLSDIGASHPILMTNAEDIDDFSVWKQLPPLPAYLHHIKLHPGSQTLAYAQAEQRGQDREPLITIREAKQKSVAIFAQDLWRWDLMMARTNDNNQFFHVLFHNIFRWLETDINNKLVQVRMEKSIYKFGEPIKMRMRIVDENMNPLSDADINVRISKEGNTVSMKAKAIGEGNFELELHPQAPGEFTAAVQADFSGRLIGEETVRFSVGAYSVERSDLRAQYELLQTLAQQTKGLCLRPDSLSALSSLQGTVLQRATTNERELWNNKILLLIIILLLSAEWFIRKRTGMV